MEKSRTVMVHLILILSLIAVPAIAQQPTDSEPLLKRYGSYAGSYSDSSSDSSSNSDSSNSSFSSFSSSSRRNHGKRGPRGHEGKKGPRGHRGKKGECGPQGQPGSQGKSGFHGKRGLSGERGHHGSRGHTGPSLEISDFYALMPSNNDNTILPGHPVFFPLTGETTGNIVRADDSSFIVPDIGLYEIQFQVSVTEPGQLVVALSDDNGSTYSEIASTVVGRGAETSQIVGMCLVRTSVANSRIVIRNPEANSVLLIITQSAGGVDSVSAHLIISKVG